MRRLLIAALIAGLLAGCGGTGGAQQGQQQQGQGQPADEATSNSVKPPAPVKGTVGEPVDVGPSVIEVVAAHKTAPNPAKGYEGEHYEGVFVALQIDYTNQTKASVEIPLDLPVMLKDAKGRVFVPEEQGYTATYTFTRDQLEYAELLPTVSPANTVHLAQAFQVAPEDVKGYTLRGGDLVCPQCGKGFEITIPGDLPQPTAPASAPATAAPSASASASGASASASASGQ